MNSLTLSSFSSELLKLASSLPPGREYPSPEMKKEYDAAHDSETEDLDAPTNYSPKYPMENISVKKASLNIVNPRVSAELRGGIRRAGNTENFHLRPQTFDADLRPSISKMAAKMTEGPLPTRIQKGSWTVGNSVKKATPPTPKMPTLQ